MRIHTTFVTKQIILVTTPAMVHIVQLRHGLLFVDQYGEDSCTCSGASLELI